MAKPRAEGGPRKHTTRRRILWEMGTNPYIKSLFLDSNMLSGNQVPGLIRHREGSIMLALSFIGLAVGFSIAAILVAIGVRLSQVDRLEAKRGSMRVRGIGDAIMGRARIRDDWMPDGRVKGGMIYNSREKRLEVSGRLSAEAFNRIFR